MTFAELRALPEYKLIPNGLGKSTATKPQLCSMIRYWSKKTNSRSRMEWFHVADGVLEFRKVLLQVRVQFQKICGIGRDDFWNEFVKHPKFSDVLVYWSEDFSHWVGFVVIEENFACHRPARSSKVKCVNSIPSWYVHLTCTEPGQGHGRKMMEQVIKDGRAAGKKYITMGALPNVVGFYASLGFKVSMDAQCRTKPALEKVPTKRFANRNKALESREYRQFLLDAVAEHMGINEHYGEDCKGIECARDGIYMEYCL